VRSGTLPLSESVIMVSELVRATSESSGAALALPMNPTSHEGFGGSSGLLRHAAAVRSAMASNAKASQLQKIPCVDGSFGQ